MQFGLSSRFRLLFSLLSATILVLAASPFAGRAAASGEQQSKQLPQSPASCQIGFADVQTTDYFYNPVRSLYCAGAIGGYSDNTFKPYNPTTRAQLSKVIVVARGFPLNTAGGPIFSDVPAGSPFYAYVETAYQRGLISGYGDGTFRPNTTITRGQIAKVVVMAQGWTLLNPGTPTFGDVPAGNPFYQYVETAVSHAVISGYGDGTFRTGSSATRGQISKIVWLASVPFSLTLEEQQTLDLVNARRAALGLGGLRMNVSLTNSSRRHSNDIGPAALCQHNGRDGSSPWDRIAQAGYTGSSMGEVVGCGYNSALGVVDGWWGSPAHYAILTDPNANDIGCGWWIGTDGYGWQTCDTGHSNR